MSKQGTRARLIELLQGIEIEHTSGDTWSLSNESILHIADFFEEERIRESNNLAHRLGNLKKKKEDAE